MKYVIKDLKIYDTAKDGSPLIDKRGKPFKRVFVDLGETAVNDKDWTGTAGYLDYNDDSANWKAGAEIDGDVVKRDVQGKIFWNFYKARPIDNLSARVDGIDEKVQDHEKRLLALEHRLGGKEDKENVEVPF